MAGVVICESAFAGESSSSGAPERLIGPLQIVVAVLAPLTLWLLWRGNVIRLSSFRAGARDLSSVSALKLTCAAVATFIAQIVAMTAAAAIVLHPGSPVQEPMSVSQQAAISLAGGLAAIGGALVALQLIVTQVSSHGGLGMFPRGSDLLRGVLSLAISTPIVLGASTLAVLCYYVATGHPPEPLAHDTLRIIVQERANPATYALIAAAVFVAPMAEELLFRVFIQSALLRAISRTWPAIFITSVLFTLAHVGSGVSSGDAQALFPLFILSLCLGVAYERSRRPWVPITMHMLFNAVNVAISLAM